METELRQEEIGGLPDGTGSQDEKYENDGNCLHEAGVGYEVADPPPEFCHYRDEGCELAGSCLDCPFPECVDESPGGRQAWRKRRRNAGMVGLYTGGGVTVKEMAVMFGVSRRTVQRALREHRLREGAAGNE